MEAKIVNKNKSSEILSEIRRNQIMIQILIFFCLLLGTFYFVLGTADLFRH